MGFGRKAIAQIRTERLIWLITLPNINIFHWNQNFSTICPVCWPNAISLSKWDPKTLENALSGPYLSSRFRSNMNTLFHFSIFYMNFTGSIWIWISLILSLTKFWFRLQTNLPFETTKFFDRLIDDLGIIPSDLAIYYDNNYLKRSVLLVKLSVLQETFSNIKPCFVEPNSLDWYRQQASQMYLTYISEI